MLSRNSSSRLKWYIHRLSVMEPVEIVHRIGAEFSIKGLEVRYRLNRPAQERELPDYKQYRFCTGTNSKLPELHWSFQSNSDEAGTLLEGKIKALGFDWTFRPDGLCWHVGPDTGKMWPRAFFGSIPYRNGNPYGDIRPAWEPSRLQHFVTLALIVREGDLGQKQRAIFLLESQFLSWVSENPLMQGIHYISVMECGLRLIAVCHALDMIRNHLRQPETVWPALVKLVEEHAALIEKRCSLYSSSGNHTVAESAALVYAGVLFPEMAGSARWKEKGLSLLESGARHQILPDGGGVEQSFHYLAFILDLYGLVIALLNHAGLKVPSIIEDRYLRGRKFLNSVSNRRGVPPSVGDSDNGVALSPFLILSGKEKKDCQSYETFPDAGYSIIRNEENPTASILFDHGPLGMPPSYGHGHADALSVIFKLGDQEILTDPGTYTYNGDPAWRSWFKSTRAHNTVAVDELDQAVRKTSFIWSDPFRSKKVFSETSLKGGFRILARHNGYSRLNEEVEHYRGISFVPSGYWLIWDYLTGQGVHTLDLHWHLGADCIEKEGEYRFLNFAQPVSLSIEGGETVSYAGATDPILGWKSRIYGVKEPITTLRTRYRGTLPHEFITRIKIDGVSQKTFSESNEVSYLKVWTI